MAPRVPPESLYFKETPPRLNCRTRLCAGAVSSRPSSCLVFSLAMGLPVSVEKVEETPDHCTYTFGSPDATMGRARLHKSSGNVELLDLSATGDGPRAPFYLAQVVPRLQAYHDRKAYPAGDQWEA